MQILHDHWTRTIDLDVLHSEKQSELYSFLYRSIHVPNTRVAYPLRDQCAITIRMRTVFLFFFNFNDSVSQIT